MASRSAVTALALAACACAPMDSMPSRGDERPDPPRVMAAYERLARATISGERARDVVAFMDGYFRVPGNEGFDASIRRVVEGLEEAGYVPEGSGAGRLTYRIERRPMERDTWQPASGSLTLRDDTVPLLTYATNKNLIAINSFSTPEGGVEAEVVDVGAARPVDFQGKDVRGRIVFGETSVSRLFAEAVQKRGALGVLAYRIPAFNHPAEHPDVISFSSIPQDAEARSWGLLLSQHARDALREALARGPVLALVRVSTRVYPSEEETLVAEVRGSTFPEQRFVLSAHVQEPGANDNATGVATLGEVARVFADGLRTGAFNPARTVTMIWGDEIRSTRRYMQEDSERAKGVRWGLSLDMVGEDTLKTGGTFLIEKMPDPSAVWTRGADHHTEWGGRPLTPDRLMPHYFNDFVLNRCLDQAEGTGWVVNTNPFEGGSDHVPFLQAGVPGLLLWHFTDVYYHTDGDRLDMVSPTEMTNAGVCAAVSAMTLTTADAGVTGFLVDEVERAALRRLSTEASLSREAVAAGADAAEERTILATWATWYDEALATMEDIEVGGPSAATRAHISAARQRVARAGRAAEEEIP